MNADYPFDYLPATPDYVLAVLQESVRVQVGDEIDSGYSVRDLIGAYNDIAWPTIKSLADCMNGTFATEIPRNEWADAFPRLRGKTVGDVCEFLAPRIMRPVIRPWKYIAGECHPAGAFLTIQSWLAKFGFPPDRITPSTPIGPYLNWFAEELVWPMARLSPNQHPFVINTYRPWIDRASASLFVGLPTAFLAVSGIAFLIVGIIQLDLGLLLMGGLLSTIGIKGLCWVYRFTKPLTSSIPGVHTFRDLAYQLVGQEPRRRLQPAS